MKRCRFLSLSLRGFGLLVLCLLVCSLLWRACCHGKQKLVIGERPEAGETKVELWYATLPYLEYLAIHYWFVVYGADGSIHRWEVWQRNWKEELINTENRIFEINNELQKENLKRKNDRNSLNKQLPDVPLCPKVDGEILYSAWGVCQKDCEKLNLFRDRYRSCTGVVYLYANVGGGPSTLDRTWSGEPAKRLRSVIENAASDYPNARTYHYWPGPNSNTFPAWVLRQAKIEADLHPTAVGKDFIGTGTPDTLGALGFGAGLTTTRTGVQVDTPIVGVKLGLKDGIEVHLLALTFGVNFSPPAIKTPAGRLGFSKKPDATTTGSHAGPGTMPARATAPAPPVPYLHSSNSTP